MGKTLLQNYKLPSIVPFETTKSQKVSNFEGHAWPKIYQLRTRLRSIVNEWNYFSRVKSVSAESAPRATFSWHHVRIGPDLCIKSCSFHLPCVYIKSPHLVLCEFVIPWQEVVQLHGNPCRKIYTITANDEVKLGFLLTACLRAERVACAVRIHPLAYSLIPEDGDHVCTMSTHFSGSLIEVRSS